MAEQSLVVVVLGLGLLLAIVACWSVAKIAGAMRAQQVLFEHLAIHLKATSVLEAQAALEPRSEPEEEEPRSSDVTNRGFDDMAAAGLDPEEPGHVAIWNATHGRGRAYAEPGDIG